MTLFNFFNIYNISQAINMFICLCRKKSIAPNDRVGESAKILSVFKNTFTFIKIKILKTIHLPSITIMDNTCRNSVLRYNIVTR